MDEAAHSSSKSMLSVPAIRSKSFCITDFAGQSVEKKEIDPGNMPDKGGGSLATKKQEQGMKTKEKGREREMGGRGRG
eukprot:765878-Hanusia_phi.AAC.5